MFKQWFVRAGDISTALYMWPPAGFYGQHSTIVWHLLKAIYGLRTNPKLRQDFLADVLEQLGLTRLVSEPNVYRNVQQTVFVMVYVDHLLFLGEQSKVNKIFEAIQQKVLLRPTGGLTYGKTISFFGRILTNKGDHIDMTLASDYIETILKEHNLQNCNPVTTPGTASLKQTINDEVPLSKGEHAQYRRAVGKLQWLTYTRPDISYATKELAGDLQAPTQHSLNKLKHLLRYLRGTQHYKQTVHPTITPQGISTFDFNVCTDADWAGCPTTRKSTSGFTMTLLGATIHFGSRTQAVAARSSAEPELYAIGTAAQEVLHAMKPSRATRTSSGKGLQRSRSPCGYKRFGVRPKRLKNKPARQSEDRSDRAWAPPTQRGATSSGHHHGFPFDEFGQTPPPRPPTSVPSITGSATSQRTYISRAGRRGSLPPRGPGNGGGWQME